MKKFVTALVALTAALFLMTGSFAEESHEVNAQITFTTDETVDSIAAPEIPIGSLSAEVFGFDAGQTYAVYSAPDVKSLRGAGGKSKVSTNDWVQVFGREGDWLLVQYDVEDKYYRIGYITAKAIPTGMTVPELNLGNETAVTMDKVNVTDDPLGNQNTLTELPADSHVTKLGIMVKLQRRKIMPLIIQKKRRKLQNEEISLVPKICRKKHSPMRTRQKKRKNLQK